MPQPEKALTDHSKAVAMFLAHPLTQMGAIVVRDANTGQDIDVIAVRDNAAGDVRILAEIVPEEGRRFYPPDGVKLVAEQDADDLTSHEPVEITPDTPVADIPMTDYRAAMIAEGVEEVSDEETYFAAWQHLEDTGLGYKLQGWFGRRLTDLIAEGKITPRQPQEG